MWLCHCCGISAAVKTFSCSSSGEEHPIPLCEGGGERPEEGRGRRWGRELVTPPWPRSHLPERDISLISTSFSPQQSLQVEDCVTWPEEVVCDHDQLVGSQLVMWPRGPVVWTAAVSGGRWEARPPPSSLQAFSAKRPEGPVVWQGLNLNSYTSVIHWLRTQGGQKDCGKQSSMLIGSLIKATMLEWNSPTSLHWNKAELFSDWLFCDWWCILCRSSFHGD